MYLDCTSHASFLVMALVAYHRILKTLSVGLAAFPVIFCFEHSRTSAVLWLSRFTETNFRTFQFSIYWLRAGAPLLPTSGSISHSLGRLRHFATRSVSFLVPNITIKKCYRRFSPDSLRPLLFYLRLLHFYRR